MFPLTSQLFLLVGVGCVLIGIAERWILINSLMKMSESSWFFWVGGIPYIGHPEGVKEFVKYGSKVLFIIGSAHLVSGVVFIPLPDFWLLNVVYILLFGLFAFFLRAVFIETALDIKRRYSMAYRKTRANSN